MRICAFSFLVALLIAPLQWGQDSQGYDNCTPVLELTGRNYSVEDSKAAVQSNIYNQYCENDTTNSNSNLDVGAKLLGSIGLSFGGSSNEETVRNFCKTYQSNYTQNQSYYRNISTVLKSTTDAWSACEQGKQQGVLFRPTVQKTQLSVGIARRGSHPGNVTAINYDTKRLSCKFDNASSLPKALTEDYWNVFCSRTPQTTSTGETIYPEADFVVDTSLAPPFPLTIPADGSVPYQFASEIQKQLNQLDGRLSLQENRQYKIAFDTEGEISVVSGNLSFPTPKDTDITPPQDKSNGASYWQRDLGTHDVCLLTGYNDQVNILGVTTACQVTEQLNNDWIVQAYGGQNRITNCSYKCGRILGSQASSGPQPPGGTN
jgi:hypothetical protein